MKIFLWIIAIIFIGGLLTLTGVFKLIFLFRPALTAHPLAPASLPIAFARSTKIKSSRPANVYPTY
ncbi:MAG: hypothetical protein ACMX3H_12230 [Sodalis sp. (in: enterobacteria)]|uniref:hypothetical protein n=1 Tax=Sodalis sp. (in: enterobacteria) TaxID=1898979 RepID=UPI0039E5521E